ncbi:phage tail assembly chaperone G [Sporolactobacillus kofuensis]|uniref:Phage tail assembly chaperone G n=1 Tax=Sporolactobacillus kofuensis TaxID=269672 RepID=A0ABW1WCB7_9BACL|nr:hypothetical protein [Sporolactobacillus kofuensis]MCO7175560.1 hypothetical protein [Sporolactobacillus kofuensis]
MEVTLTIDGKEKKFSSGKVYLAALINLTEMQTRIDFKTLDKKEDIQEFAQFIADDIFHGQFTSEELINGIDMIEWNKKYLEFFDVVMGILPSAETEEEKN